MDLTKEALSYINSLAEPSYHKDAEGREYCDKHLHSIHPALPDEIDVTTLGGFCDLIRENIEKFDRAMVLTQVASHEEVILLAKVSDLWGRRQRFAHAKMVATEGFRFGAFLDHESFLIGVLANFTPTPDRDYLVQIASHIGSEKIRTSLDDGISQEATLKSGASLKTNVAIKNRLTLAPYRTFREVAQPQSEFLFRLRGGTETQPPTLALFESDGGKWQIDAMEEIGRYLRASGLDVPVVI